MAVGIRPNTELAESAGLHCNRGIAYGLAAPLFEQAKVRANHHLAG